MIVADTYFNKQGYYTEPTLDVDILRDPKSVDLFDQNGYHLTKAEQAFLITFKTQSSFKSAVNFLISECH